MVLSFGGVIRVKEATASSDASLNKVDVEGSVGPCSLAASWRKSALPGIIKSKQTFSEVNALISCLHSCICIIKVKHKS